MIKATCTWGDGPDIILELKEHSLICYENPLHHDRFIHGVISNGSTDLTLAEAKQLVSTLLSSITQVEELESACEKYHEQLSPILEIDIAYIWDKVHIFTHVHGGDQDDTETYVDAVIDVEDWIWQGGE